MIGPNESRSDHEREIANLREQIAAMEEQFVVAMERLKEWKARAEKAEDTIARQALLLTRKSEALSVFADENCWIMQAFLSPASLVLPPRDCTKRVWNGAGPYRDPVAFARKEGAADAPCD